jgi:hypothetical protein
MVPATTIWNGGVRLENSILNKQKFVYRRQRGCQFIPVPVDPCYIISNIFDYTCNTEYVILTFIHGLMVILLYQTLVVFLVNRVNNMLAQSGLTLNQCYQNSVLSDWYVDLTINGNKLLKNLSIQDMDMSDVPTNSQWRNALINYLPTI